MKLRKSSRIKDRRIALKPKVTSILIKRIIIVLAMAIISGIFTGAVLANPLISTGSTWRYMDDGSDQGTAWRQHDFADAGWSSGQAQLGYGDGDEATVVDFGGNASNKYITTYFRQIFQVSDPAAYPALLLKVLRDDGCVVYLNEVEVARSNMPGAPGSDDIYYDTLAGSAIGGSDESTFFEFSVDGSLLQSGDNVVAVEIHQGSTSSSDISFDLQLDVPGAATLLKGPYLLFPGVNTEMTVLWQLDNATACTIEWGQDTNYDDGFAITTEYGSDHQHKYTITALTPGEKYFYRVVNGASEYTGSFRAAPPDNAENVKFLAYGDTRSYPSIHDSVAAAMIDTYTDDPAYQTFALHAGDWVNDGDTESDWADQFFPQTQPNLREFIANVPINGCKGNHEGSGDLFYKYWPYRYENNFYWSFDYGPVHVVVLDQYVSYSQGSTQYNWLENDLAMTTKPWKVIIFHEPGWSAGGGHDNNSVVQDDIQPLCETYGVDIVFAGHNHYYARADVNGIQHITTGGGGAPLRTPDSSYPYVVAAEETHHFCEIEIQGEVLHLTARDAEGSVIDAFSLINEGGDVFTSEVQVASGSDDAEETPNGYVVLGSSDLELVYDGSTKQTVGIRFNGLNVPQGATIVNAYVQFQADETSSEATTLTIEGEDIDNAPTFASSSGNISSRARTSTNVSWSPVPWTMIGQAGPDQRKPDISQIIQEIVEQPGWLSGNSLAFIITGTGTRVAESYNGDQGGAPLLHVEYTTGTPINQPPVVDAGADETIILPVDNVLLEASAIDDGLPSGVLTTEWSQFSGPARQVVFDDAYAIQTTARFLSAGTYVLQLSADDGELTASDQVTIVVNEGGDGDVVEVRVNQSSDDAEERDYGIMSLANSDLELVYDGKYGSDQTVGIRFSGVAIPQNANIVNAYVQFQVDETSSGSTSLTIEGEAIDDAPTFTSSSGNISSRARTSANVSWSPVPWTMIGQAGSDQRTPDISRIIQEIVNRSGWLSGNSLAFIITGTGTRIAESYDGDPDGAPLLHVEYTTGTPINQPPVVDAGADETIILPVNTLDLDATCTDDGLPDGTLNFQWSQLSGPDTVTFDDDSAEDTTATFPASGVYVLRLTADDTELFTSDDIQVTVSAEPINLAPEVDAGANQTITLPVDNVLLEASATDDGLPSGVLTTEWSQFSGPASQVVFDDAYAIQTTATFLSAGTYVLQLSADDGELTASDQVTIIVNEGGGEVVISESRVSAGSDDAEERAYGIMSLLNVDLELVYDAKYGFDQTVGIRFSGMAIPQNANIVHAYVQFQVDETSSGSTSLTIEGEAIDDAPTFTSSSGNISSRARTSTNVSWSPVPWTMIGQAGPDQRTPDISQIIQEIVEQPGWLSGNSLAFIITGTGTRVAESYDGDPDGAPLLHVEYTTGTPINQPPVVDAGADETIILPVDNVLLEASATDDGLPSGVLTTEWSQFSGPASQVVFDDAYAIQTTATFLSAGTYVLQLSADDGELTASDQVTIIVNEGGGEVVISESRVSAGSDDAEERAYGIMSLLNVDLELVYDGKYGFDQTVGIRFSGVAIPQNANIVNAYVQFQVDETSSGSTSLTIEGEAIDDAPTFASSNDNISSRARTSTNVSWSPVPWTTIGQAGPDQRTPDISQIIQEIVEQPGWLSGNSLAFIITGTGTRVAESYDGDPDGAPLLHVEYTTGTPINQPPVVDAGADETIILPVDNVLLEASATDDGLPSGVLTTEWSQFSGPASQVVFDDAYAIQTAATFLSAGTYVLQLSADDGELTASDQVTIVVNEGGDGDVVEVRVNQSSDDAEERDYGIMSLANSDLELVYDGKYGSDQTVGIRFSGMAIPQNANIVNAFVQFQVDETSSGSTSLTIEGEAIDDAPTFISSSGNISSRARTSANVSWSPVPWTTIGQAGSDQRTPDISRIIQEIVEQPDWLSGNSLAFIITGTGTRVAESYNGDQGGAPLLHVEYGAP